MAGPQIQVAEFSPHEVVVHFDDPSESSAEILAAMKRLGLDLTMTSDQLDKLRDRGAELRSWLRREPDGYDEFVRNPLGSLAALDEQTPPGSRRHGNPPGARRIGAGESGPAAATGAEVAAAWVPDEPNDAATSTTNADDGRK